MSSPHETRDLVVSWFSMRILEWVDIFRESHGKSVLFALEGAMKCQLFRGPRPSLNPALSGRLIVEIDYSLRLPEDMDPHNQAVVSLVESIVNVKLVSKSHVNGWKSPANLSLFYGYFEVPGVGEVELELCVQKECETCELSDFWRDVFSKDERAEQRARRDRAEQLGAEAYSQEKHYQNEEAKWRLLFRFATGLSSPPPQHIRNLIPRWYEFAPQECPGPLSPEWVREAWKLAHVKRAPCSGPHAAQ